MEKHFYGFCLQAFNSEDILKYVTLKITLNQWEKKIILTKKTNMLNSKL